MGDTFETENSHAGFIAVHVGRFNSDAMNMKM
jgi:hypothetical protein